MVTNSVRFRARVSYAMTCAALLLVLLATAAYDAHGYTMITSNTRILPSGIVVNMSPHRGPAAIAAARAVIA